MSEDENDIITSFPDKNDVLFEGDKDWELNACIFKVDVDWNLYVSAYKLAADNLIKGLAKDNWNKDLLIYPIIFLYRHYIELQLKRIILQGINLLDKSIKMPLHHDLREIWNICKNILLEIKADESYSFEDLTDELLNSFEKLLNEFVKRDPNSMSFRYPVDKEGTCSIKAQELISIKTLYESMQKIDTLSTGITLEIELRQEYKQEIMKAFL